MLLSKKSIYLDKLSQILNKNLFKRKIKYFKDITFMIAQDKKFVNKDQGGNDNEQNNI